MIEQYFDLILVYTSHRRHEPYINIIKYLSSDIKIGLLKFKPLHPWGKTEEEYVRQCIDYGATLVTGKSTCNLLMLPRFGGKPGSGYYKYILEETPKIIDYKKVLLWPASVFHGHPLITEICEVFNPLTILMPSKRYFGAIEKKTMDVIDKYKIDTVEVGLPYAKYPIFPLFSTDYILAYPSHVAIHDAHHHYKLLSNMIKVLFNLPYGADIVVKPHNVKDEGNKLSQYDFLRFKLDKRIVAIILKIILFIFGLNIFSKNFYKFLPSRSIRLVNQLINYYIFNSYNNLLDKYPGFGIEHFIHGIKHGLITGLSSSIIYARYEKKQVCVVDEYDDEMSESYKLINKHFGIKHQNQFSENGYDAFTENNRESDLFEYLMSSISLYQVSH